MKETGRVLREAREAQNISLAAVSAVTKIGVRVLEAIENAQMENLPSKTFLRGFVQTYAQFLKLSVDDVLDTFQKEMGTTKYTPVISLDADGKPLENGEGAPGDQVAPVNNAPAAPKEEDEGLAYANGGRSLTSKLIFAGIAALLIGGIYLVSQVVQKYQKESVVPAPSPEIQSNAITEPKKDTTAEAAAPAGDSNTQPAKQEKPETPAAEKTASAEKPPAAEAKAGDGKPGATPPTPTHTTANAAANAAGPAAIAPATQEKPKTPETKPEGAKPVAAKPESAPKPKEKPTATAAEKTAPTEKPPVAEPKPTPIAHSQEVIIEALDAVKVDYRIDGGVLETVNLQPEEKHTFRAKRELKMDVSDGGAVSVNHNGKDRGVPGNLGQPMKLSFP
jgi:cytoskeleton protein RodZ